MMLITSKRMHRLYVSLRHLFPSSCFGSLNGSCLQHKKVLLLNEDPRLRKKRINKEVYIMLAFSLLELKIIYVLKRILNLFQSGNSRL